MAGLIWITLELSNQIKAIRVNVKPASVTFLAPSSSELDRVEHGVVQLLQLDSHTVVSTKLRSDVKKMFAILNYVVENSEPLCSFVGECRCFTSSSLIKNLQESITSSARKRNGLFISGCVVKAQVQFYRSSQWRRVIKLMLDR